METTYQPQPAATESQIADLQARFLENYTYVLPDGYLQFLSEQNGLIKGEVCIGATNTRMDSDGEVVIDGLEELNWQGDLDWAIIFGLMPVGETTEGECLPGYLIYYLEGNVFKHIHNDRDYEEIANFATFSEMLTYALKKAE